MYSWKHLLTRQNQNLLDVYLQKMKYQLSIHCVILVQHCRDTISQTLLNRTTTPPSLNLIHTHIKQTHTTEPRSCNFFSHSHLHGDRSQLYVLHIATQTDRVSLPAHPYKYGERELLRHSWLVTAFCLFSLARKTFVLCLFPNCHSNLFSSSDKLCLLQTLSPSHEQLHSLPCCWEMNISSSVYLSHMSFLLVFLIFQSLSSLYGLLTL